MTWTDSILVEDVVDRLPDLGSKGAYLKQHMQDKLIEHKHYIDKHGQDLAGNPQLEVEPGRNAKTVNRFGENAPAATQTNERNPKCPFNSMKKTAGRCSLFTSAASWPRRITSTLCRSSNDSSGSMENCACCSI